MDTVSEGDYIAFQSILENLDDKQLTSLMSENVLKSVWITAITRNSPRIGRYGEKINPPPINKEILKKLIQMGAKTEWRDLYRKEVPQEFLQIGGSYTINTLTGRKIKII